MKAVWKDVTIAESDDTVVVEGNHYFPRESLKEGLFSANSDTSVCPWKGTASYLDVNVAGETNPGAAWFYAEPKEAAAQIRGRVAFWRGVTVSE
jgi:uncharacterized protein (DUF427 family)